MEDAILLDFISNRLQHKYSENPNTDYMIKLNKIISDMYKNSDNPLVKPIICNVADTCYFAGKTERCYNDHNICHEYTKIGNVFAPVEPLAPKSDENKYDKCDYSLVPWLILSKNYILDREPVMKLQFELHQWMNGKSELTIKDLLELGLNAIDVKHLAVALGYGCVKYKRDSWKIGFGGDYDRMIKACIRHCHAYLCGEEYDHEAVDGYPEGLSHLGGILFNLMTAEREVGK